MGHRGGWVPLGHFFYLTYPWPERTIRFQVLPDHSAYLPPFPRGVGRLGTKSRPLKAQEGPSQCEWHPPLFSSGGRTVSASERIVLLLTPVIQSS